MMKDPDLKQIGLEEWTFVSWGLCIHVKGYKEKAYVEKHFNIFKEELNRIRIRNEKQITFKIQKIKTKVTVSKGVTVKFLYDKELLKSHGIDKPTIICYLDDPSGPKRDLPLSYFLNLYKKRKDIDNRLMNIIDKQEKEYKLGLENR